jgi:2-polyprenyl-6-methoxyphenol hydroxylase-like FAD-dependent oxidoreductase
VFQAEFADGSWRVPELLQRFHAAGDLYFDSVSQMRVRPWWRGRVALVGDAASCMSLFGDGSSLAMAGAFTLAEELAASPSDHRLAYRRYEARHRTLVDPRQRNIAREASCSSRRRGPASRPGTWPPGCGRWAPPRAGCGAALPRGVEEPRTWSRW